MQKTFKQLIGYYADKGMLYSYSLERKSKIFFFCFYFTRMSCSFPHYQPERLNGCCKVVYPKSEYFHGFESFLPYFNIRMHTLLYKQQMACMTSLICAWVFRSAVIYFPLLSGCCCLSSLLVFFLCPPISSPCSVFTSFFCTSAWPFSLPGPSVSSLEHCSPLTEGRSRSLRSSRSFGGSSVTMVKMTPLSSLPGTRIIKYLGIINMFFIRETTSLREVLLKATQTHCVAFRPSGVLFVTWNTLDLYRKVGLVASFIRSSQRCSRWFELM